MIKQSLKAFTKNGIILLLHSSEDQSCSINIFLIPTMSK